jgi:hypothetical protein
MMIPHAKTWSVIATRQRSEQDALVVTNRSGTQHGADNAPFDMFCHSASLRFDSKHGESWEPIAARRIFDPRWSAGSRQRPLRCFSCHNAWSFPVKGSLLTAKKVASRTLLCPRISLWRAESRRTDCNPTFCARMKRS